MANKIVSHAFTADLGEGSNVPSLIQLLPSSPFTGRDGRGPFAFDAQPLLDAFAMNGKPLHIDYEHQSIGAADKTQATPAAGWINALIPQEDGSLWASVEWTDKAAAHIAAREYRYISPVFSFNTKSGSIAAMRGAGLTNDPNLYLQSLNSQEADFYTSETTHSEEEMLIKILEALGLATDAAEEAVLAHVASLKTAADKVAAVAVEVGSTADADAPAIVQAAQSRFATDLSTYVPAADLEAMSQKAQAAEALVVEANARADAATAEVKQMKDAAHTKAVEDAVGAAIESGKFTPAQSEQLLKFARADLESFKAFVATSAVHAIAQHSLATRNEEVSHGLTADQLAFCKSQKIDPAVYAKHIKQSR